MEVVKKYNLTIKESKSKYSQTSTNLGYAIEDGTIKPDPDGLSPLQMDLEIF